MTCSVVTKTIDCFSDVFTAIDVCLILSLPGLNVNHRNSCVQHSKILSIERQTKICKVYEHMQEAHLCKFSLPNQQYLQLELHRELYLLSCCRFFCRTLLCRWQWLFLCIWVHHERLFWIFQHHLNLVDQQSPSSGSVVLCRCFATRDFQSWRNLCFALFELRR